MEKDKVGLGKIVLIGGSAGSLDVVSHILPLLRTDLHIAIVIVLHRKSTSDSLLTDVLKLKTTLPLMEAEEKQQISKGHIYVAPADYHLLVEKDRSFSLDYSEKVNYSRPSIDVTFESAADAFGKEATAVILSGANADGVNGLKAIKAKGGKTIVQDPASAEVSYMPAMALEHASPDMVFTPLEIADYINALL